MEVGGQTDRQTDRDAAGSSSRGMERLTCTGPYFAPALSSFSHPCMSRAHTQACILACVCILSASLLPLWNVSGTINTNIRFYQKSKRHF